MLGALPATQQHRLLGGLYSNWYVCLFFSLANRADETSLNIAWSIAMAYHAQEHLSIADALVRAAIYVPLCFGVKSLVSGRPPSDMPVTNRYCGYQIMTIDDILDYDIDGMVERTKGRPLPRGSISLQRAWLFFAIQTVIGIRSAFYFLSTTSYAYILICQRFEILTPPNSIPAYTFQCSHGPCILSIRRVK